MSAHSPGRTVQDTPVDVDKQVAAGEPINGEATRMR
jgi:hypothetical protein